MAGAVGFLVADDNHRDSCMLSENGRATPIWGWIHLCVLTSRQSCFSVWKQLDTLVNSRHQPHRKSVGCSRLERVLRALEACISPLQSPARLSYMQVGFTIAYWQGHSQHVSACSCIRGTFFLLQTRIPTHKQVLCTRVIAQCCVEKSENVCVSELMRTTLLSGNNFF